MLGPLTYGALSQVSAVPWYLSGGAPAPIAVYEAKGAASQAASYVNIVNPGTFNAAPGVAPTWAVGTGWGMNGTTTYLTTGIVPADGWAAVIRFSDRTGATRQDAFGCVTLGDTRFFCRPLHDASNRIYGQGSFVSVAGVLSGGVMGIAGQQGYLNGSADGTAIGAWSGTGTREIFIGALNNNGTVTNFLAANVLYFAIWNTAVGHATWMPAVSQAVSLL